jgi:hypothetical protein
VREIRILVGVLKSAGGECWQKSELTGKMTGWGSSPIKMSSIVEKAYKGTVYEHIGMLYHDGLTQWWTPESQAYIASRGWQYPQLCCRDPTNQLHPSGDPRKINRYQNKTIGDRPEFARGLDSYGFAHFKAYIMYMRCLTSVYPRTDPRRFLFGTIPEVESTMRRCWTMAPTSDQIKADILDFPRFLGNNYFC